MEKRQKMANVNLINSFIDDKDEDEDDDDNNSGKRNFIFFCLSTEPSTFSSLHLVPLIHLFLVKFRMM